MPQALTLPLSEAPSRVYRSLVNRGGRRAAEATGLTLRDEPSHQGSVKGTVSYGVAGAPTTITIAQLQFVEAARSFPADCGVARVRHGSPELHFAQLDPYDDKRLVRTLVVRWERGRFIERAKSNEPFRLTLETRLTSDTPDPIEHRAPRQQGVLTELFNQARFAGEPVTAMIDAEFDMSSYSGGRAGMVFLRASTNQLASALVAQSKELYFEPALEVTLTTALLADLLLSWKNVAETIQ